MQGKEQKGWRGPAGITAPSAGEMYMENMALMDQMCLEQPEELIRAHL